MSGKITFHFDDGHKSHYTKAFPIFKKYGYVGCLALMTSFEPWGLTKEEALEMQNAGWEIMSHSVTHCKMNIPLDEETAQREIKESRMMLEAQGFNISTFITPMSACDKALSPILQANYNATFTIYKNSAIVPIEELIIKRPFNRYELNRACMAGKTIDELKAYIDYVIENDAWLILYDHDIGARNNITEEKLDGLLSYCKETGVDVITTREAISQEKCTVKIITEGFDGKNCLVHTRGASNGNDMLLTAQYLNVMGNDDFECIHTNFSCNGGKAWQGFLPDETFKSVINGNIRTVCCDMTPFYHKKTGKFIVTGHTADYFTNENAPVPSIYRTRILPYAVFDTETKKFGKLNAIKMPDPQKYRNCGSGCSQCTELENGDMLIPISFGEIKDNKKQNDKAAVIRCSFDGSELKFISISNELEVKDSVRGIGEASILHFNGKFYLTIRDDAHGYLSVSDDGNTFSEPQKWRFDNGEIVPTYNTQSHWLTSNGKAYLVYTRKAGTNDHVFRHRAPLFVAEFDPEKLVLKRDTEFVAVPERGARLGNFGVFNIDENNAVIVASEWMQPVGCEKYGSNNAVWIADINMK